MSPIRSVIIRVINKIGRPRSGSPICLIPTVLLNCPIKAEIRAVDSQSDLTIFVIVMIKLGNIVVGIK